MKPHLLFFLLVGLLLGGCNASEPQTNQSAQTAKKALSKPNPEMPLCKIETIDSCEVESVGTNETIYRCNYCEPGAVCPECADHACENCSEAKCRCRLKNQASDERAQPK
jgi:hypothetical protein